MKYEIHYIKLVAAKPIRGKYTSAVKSLNIIDAQSWSNYLDVKHNSQ